MYWYKIETNKHKDGTYHYIGASPLKPDELVASLQRGEYLQLTNLLYVDEGKYREWTEWDSTLLPSVRINPSCVLTVMQLHGDPRTLAPRDTAQH
ncbi:MAG: hypothetical protein U1F34_07380 [Gammaproteobacteria bacterium]